MRLLPTAGEGTFRVSKQDVRLGDLTVPAGQPYGAQQLDPNDAGRQQCLDVQQVLAPLLFNCTVPGWRLFSCLLQAAGIFIWSFFLGTFTHPDIWDDPDSYKPVSPPAWLI